MRAVHEAFLLIDGESWTLNPLLKPLNPQPFAVNKMVGHVVMESLGVNEF